MPRNLSIITPSRCPSCNILINSNDNILIPKLYPARRECRIWAKISFRYPLSNSSMHHYTSLVAVGLDYILFILFSFSPCCHNLYRPGFPDNFRQITLPGIPIGLVAGSLLMPDPFLRYSLLGFKASIIGFLAGGSLFYVIAFLSKGGMGGGDIKMMAMVGALMGWKSVLSTTFFGSLAGSVFGIFLMISRGKGRKTKIPFGPFLALGTLITLFYGQEILLWYLGR
jgi:leader peptidase (prepilin peptidase)/N-methyltransferase